MGSIKINLRDHSCKFVFQVDASTCIVCWELFSMLPCETMTDYRRRLRVLLEDLSLCGIVKTLDEVLIKWKHGLNLLIKEWLFYIERAFIDPGSAIHIIYRLERLVCRRSGGLEIDDIVFLISNQSARPLPPDFRVWEPVGNNVIYAHDVRADHLGVRDTDPFYEDQLMEHFAINSVPTDRLIQRPPIIPELEPPSINPLEPSGGMMGRKRRRSTKEEVNDYATRRIKKIKEESEHFAQKMKGTKEMEDLYLGSKFGVGRGPSQGIGGWLEAEPPAPREKDIKIGTSNTDMDLVSSQQSHISDSDSNSEDIYPSLDPRDKGKGPLYPTSK